MVNNNAGVFEAHIFLKNVGPNGYQELAGRTLPGFTGTGTLRFEVVGNQLKLFVNGVLQLVAYDSTITAPGLAGIRNLNASMDNFSAAAVPTQTATVPFTDHFTNANNSDLDRVWTERTGAFTIQGNAAAATDAVSGVSIATLNTSPLPNSDVSAGCPGQRNRRPARGCSHAIPAPAKITFTWA